MENIINLGLTQALDIKDSGNIGTSAKGEGDSGFANLVEQHINAGKTDRDKKIEATNQERENLVTNDIEPERSTKPKDAALKESQAANTSLNKERQVRAESSGDVNNNSESVSEESVEPVADKEASSEPVSQNGQTSSPQANTNTTNNTQASAPELSSASKLLELVNRSELLIQKDNSANGNQQNDRDSQSDDGLITLPVDKRIKQDRLFNHNPGIVTNELKQTADSSSTENIDTNNTDDGQAVQRIQALAQAQPSKIAQSLKGEVADKEFEASSTSKVTQAPRAVLDHELSIKERLLAGSGSELSQNPRAPQAVAKNIESAASAAVLSHAVANNEQQIKQTLTSQTQQVAAEVSKVKVLAESELVAQQQAAESQAETELGIAVKTASELGAVANTKDNTKESVGVSTSDNDVVLSKEAGAQAAANTTNSQQSSTSANLSSDSAEPLTAQPSDLDISRQLVSGQVNTEQERSVNSQTNNQVNAGGHNRTADLSVSAQSNTSQGNNQNPNSQQGQNSDAQLTAEQQVEQDIIVAESDKNSLKPEQQAHRSSAFQATLDAASQANERSIQQTRATTEQQTYLEEVANQVTQDNVQVQKKQAAQLTETINIYRKDFSAQLKDKVMVMVSQKLQQVDIQLDPPELGNVQVRVNLQNEQAAVSFVVQNQQAKEALEQNINRLKDMLAGSGVDVGDANIEQRNQQNQDQLAQGDAGTGRGSNQPEQDQGQVAEHDQQSYVVKGSAVGVDYYA